MDALGGLSLRAITGFIMLLFVVVPVQAQEERFLPFFTPVAGTLTSGQVDEWTFSIGTGAMLSFHARATAGDLDPILTITDTAGEVVRCHAE